jgi:hypothetical protein
LKQIGIANLLTFKDEDEKSDVYWFRGSREETP